MEATSWLAAALVAVTIYYAWQNQRMVGEMRASRRLSIAPKLSISIFMLTTTYGLARLVNVGQGPALDVDVVISFVPRDTGDAEERTWKAPVMPPGEVHDFMPPDRPSMEALANDFSEIRVDGTMRSSLNESMQVSETTGDLREWFDMSVVAMHYWEEEWTRKMPKELEKIRKVLVQIQKK